MALENFATRWVCPKCGNCDMFPLDACLGCGHPFYHDWKRSICRLVATSIWWKPHTWGRTKWEH